MYQRVFTFRLVFICLLGVLIISGLLVLNGVSASTGTLTTQTIEDEIAYVTLEDSNKIALVDVATQYVIETIDTGEYGCYSPWRATMSPDGDFVYFGCYNSGSVLVIETDTNSVVTNIPDIPNADDVAFTQFGDYALVGSRWSAQIAVIDTATYNIVQYIYTDSYPRSIAMHPYLERAYATSESGQILVIDTSTFIIIDSIYVGSAPWDVEVSPDGQWVYAGDRWGNGLWVIDANTNSLYTTIGGMGELTGLAVSPDGAYIFAGGLYEEVWVLDAANFSLITSVAINGNAWEIGLTKDATQLYVGNTTSQVAVIDAVAFTLSGYIDLPGNTTRGIAITPEYVSGDIGILEGHVYNQAMAPIPNSHIFTSPGPYQQWTDADGYYHMILMHGTYTVTAEAYGYYPVSVMVEIITDTITTQDFTLEPAPLVVVSGTVTDGQTGWPLYAYISIEGYPEGGVWTDPASGFYSVSLPEGNSYKFTISVWSGGYVSTQIQVGPLDGDITENLAVNVDLVSCDAPGYHITPYTQDFEADDGGFTAEGSNSSWEWGTPAGNPAYPGPVTAHSGSNVWATNLDGQYNYYENSYLESPDIDLTSVGDQQTNFTWWQWLITGWNDLIDIQVSNDGGQTWSTVYGPTYGSIEDQWTNHSIILDPAFAVFNFRVRFHLSADGYNPEEGWYLDDLGLGACEPQEGGLVVGNVYETRFGMPLTGAQVSNDSGETTNTGITIDPAVDDSFYILFSQEGSRDFTASYPGYNTINEQVDVILGSTVLHNFYLPSGELVPDPEALQADVYVGDSLTETLTLHNIGDGYASFEFKERNEGLIPGKAAIPSGILPEENLITDAQQAFPKEESTAHIMDGAEVLLIQDYDPWGYPVMTDLLETYSIQYDLINSWDIPVWNFSPYTMIIIPSVQGWDFYNYFNNNLGKFEQYIDEGGLLLLSTCTQGNMVWLPFGGNNFNDYQYHDYLVEPDNPIFDGVPNPIYGSPASTDSLYGVLPDDRILVTTGSEPGGNVVMLEREYGSGLLVAGGLTYEYGWIYGQDAGVILNNMIPYYNAWSDINKVSWLVEEPISGTIPAYNDLPVQITFDASQVNQPGDYLATLTVKNDTFYGPFEIPVTMDVAPTADMGHTAGTVSDAWSGDPIEATVELEGVYAMQANPDYDIWAVEGTYSLTAYTEGYYTVTLPVEIFAGDITVQDIALEPALPRMGEVPDQISMTLPQGSLGSVEMPMVNDGPMPLDFDIHEINSLKLGNGANTLAGIQILYDRAHCQDDLWSYSSLFSDLTNAGATIDENFDPFDDSTLEGYDILWLNYGGCVWSFDELQILDNWLADGGAILIQSTVSPAASGPASIFDISYQSGWCNYGTTNYINPHPITEGVDEFYVDWTCEYLTGSPEEVILDMNMQTHVIAAEQGEGKMVVIAASDFTDWVISYNDNRVMAMNSFQWLAIPVYSDIPWLLETPEEGNIDGHSSITITIDLNASELYSGVYDGLLAIEHNDPNQNSPILIPVELTVTESIPPEGVSISGLESGEVRERLEFTAGVIPDNTSLPLTYLWEANGQEPITHTGGLSDTVIFTWDIPGTKVITVTVLNDYGSVGGNYQITINPYVIYLPVMQKIGGSDKGQTGEADEISVSIPPNLLYPSKRK